MTSKQVTNSIMGNTLKQPITEKHYTEHENEQFKVVSCSMQGWRRSMEDAQIVSLGIQKSKFSQDKSASLFGVFDGHAGERAAKFVSENLPRYITGKKS